MKIHRIVIAIPLLFGLSLALLSPGCDKLITEVNNITLIDTTLGKECKACHTDKDDQLIVIPKGQWENSAHANASLLEYPIRLNGQLKTATACGPSCHSGDAYVDSVLTGHVSDTTKPSVINCYTCHLPHSVPTDAGSLDSLRGISLAVTLADGESKYLRDGIGGIGRFGKSTMCANCHRATGAPPSQTTTSDITLTTNFGPHYSAQADVLNGTAGFKFDTATIPTPHKAGSVDGCIDCHFGKGRGYDLGEHTFRLQYHGAAQDTTPYLANCTAAGCHLNASASNFFAVGTDQAPASTARGDSIRQFANTLRSLLESSFILNPDDTAGTMYTVGDILPADGAKILYNYLLYRHDGSRGIHNPPLMNYLLKRSLVQWDSIPPRADFVISDNDVCVGDPITFTNRTRFTYHSSEWTFGGGGSSTVTSPVYSYAAAGIYSVTLKAINDTTNENSSATKANAITVHGPLTARIFVSTPIVCYNGSVTLVDSSDGVPSSSQWHFIVADSTYSGRTVSFDPVKVGADSVLVMLRSFNNCTPGGDSVLEYVKYSADTTPVANFGWLQPIVDTSTVVQFEDSSTGPPRSWEWTFNVGQADSSKSTLQNPTYQFHVVGTWQVRLKVTNPCGTNSKLISISVGAGSASPAEITPSLGQKSGK